MSSYKGHSCFNIFLALPLLVGGIFYFLHPKPAFLYTFIGAFAYTTLFMSPDLDLAYNIKLFSLRGFLSLPFRSYSRVFKHRGISHSFLLGSLTRILWLTAIGVLIFFIVYKTLPSQKSLLLFWKQYKFYLIYGFVGICIADWCHLLLDIEIKK